MNITNPEDRIEMSDVEIELRAKIVLLETELNERKTGRPLTLPNKLLVDEYNWLFDYLVKQKKMFDKFAKTMNRSKIKAKA